MSDSNNPLQERLLSMHLSLMSVLAAGFTLHPLSVVIFLLPPQHSDPLVSHNFLQWLSLIRKDIIPLLGLTHGAFPHEMLTNSLLLSPLQEAGFYVYLCFLYFNQGMVWRGCGIIVPWIEPNCEIHEFYFSYPNIPPLAITPGVHITFNDLVLATGWNSLSPQPINDFAPLINADIVLSWVT